MKTLHLVIAISLVNALFLTGGIFIASKRVTQSIPTPTPTPTLVTSPSAIPTTIPTTSPILTATPTLLPTSKPTTAPTPDNRCLIQIDGVAYNVTVFRTIHGGGDIFQCGTDMSTIFHNQHSNSYLEKMQKYRI